MLKKGIGKGLKKAISVVITCCIICFCKINIEAEQVKTWSVKLDMQLSLAIKYDQSINKIFEDAWNDYEPSINIYTYKIKVKDFVEVYTSILRKYPECFFVDSSKVEFVSVDEYVSTVYFDYLYTKSECDEQRKELDNAVDSIIAKTNGITSDEDKVVFFHDYIVTHNKYDVAALIDVDSVKSYSYTAYGCLVDGVSVCEGMSDAFVLLCKKVGINTGVVSSNPMVHAWNIVEINDRYYHLDITWNDAARDIGLGYDGESENYDFLDVKGFSSHKYFLKSDSQFSSLEHYSWKAEFLGTDSATYNNYYWEDVYSNIFFIKGNQYYIKNSSVIKRNPKTSEETVLYTVSDSAFSVGTKEYVWSSKNAVLAYDYKHNFLLMNLHDGVYALNLSNNQVTKVYDYTDDGYIVGIAFDGEDFVYDIASVDKNAKLYQISDLSAVIDFPEYSAYYGDADNSGSFSIADILKLKKYAANLESDINEFNSDVNEDNSIDAKDILLITKKLAGFDIAFGG